MNHRQRLEACLSDSAVDRPPVALWRHFPVDDQNPSTLADSILEFQKSFDFDLIKITPASSFCIKDYGVVDQWQGNPEGTRNYLSYPIKEPSDWTSLALLPPGEGSLGAQLECIKQVISGKSKDTPVIQTVFDPMSQAKNLVGRETLLVHMRQHPKELHAGLHRLAENTMEFIKACIPLGIDGIFFAVQHAQSSLLNNEELDEFVLSYDREILKLADKLWLNVMHAHGKDIYFDKLAEISSTVINWHDLETPPDLSSGKSKFPGAVCGGLRQWETLVYGTPQSVTEEAQKAIRNTDGKRFILGTGCVLPIIAPRGNILAARKAVENVS